MICAVIKGPTLTEVRDQLKRAMNGASIVELRLDFFAPEALKHLQQLLNDFSLPMIFTLRPLDQGGAFSGSEERRLEQIRNFAKLKPAYFDLEYTIPAQFASELKEEHPQIQIIISFHDFDKMPPLEATLSKLKKVQGDLYKIAVMPHSSVEALSLLNFMRSHRSNVLAMGMGLYGKITRILAPIFGGRFVYASLEVELATAEGQITVADLNTIYHYTDLSPSTAIYGLIGNPLGTSFGYLTHNAVMQAVGLDAVYLNFPLYPDQLKQFLELAKTVDIKGLSATMPLKEMCIPYLDQIDPWAKKAGSVNTLKIEQGKISGCSTDGDGALDSIEEKMPVKGKKVIFIGAGGACRAAASVAILRGAEVIILNRDEERAIKLADELGCKGGSLTQLKVEFQRGYQVLINATPAPMPIDPELILPRSIVMDMVISPIETPFLLEAKKRGCSLVYGYEMFANQAVGQFHFWFSKKITPDTIKRVVWDRVKR